MVSSTGCVIVVILIAAAFIFLSGWMLDEENIDIHNSFWRSLINAIAWSLNGVGGALLTSVILSFLLPNRIQTTFLDLQQNSIL